MPTLSTFYGIVIRMFWSDHNPPHFHAFYGGEEVLVDIRRLEVMERDLPRRALVFVLDSAEVRQDELLEAWDRCWKRRQPGTIAPLR